MINVVILGGHGDGLVAAGVIHDMAKAGTQIRLAGFLNDALAPGELIHGVPVLGRTRDWAELDESYLLHVCLHKVGQMRQRSELIDSFSIPEDRLISLIHPTATIAADVIIRPGTLIASHVTCQPGAKIGRYATVRAGANLGHDTVLEDFAYLGPNATLCGCARLSRGAHAGPNSVVIDGLQVGPFSVLAAGAAVMRNTEADSVWMGNPARCVR